MKTGTTLRLLTWIATTIGGVSASAQNPRPADVVVTAGDASATHTVVWARVTAPGLAKTELSTDPRFPRFGTRSRRDRVTDAAVPLKRTFRWLAPGQRYYVRVTDGAGQTGTGTFRTAERAGEHAGLHFGVSGDWQQAPAYASLTNADDAALDFFFKLGDTIYADAETPALPGQVQARTLSDFRTKQNESVSGRFGRNFMKALYASTSLYQTIDDHELVDNFAGGAAPGDSPDAGDINPGEPPLFTDPVRYVNETQAYRDALQAFREYHPIEETDWFAPFDPRLHGKPKLYRYRQFGDDAALMVLDTRSFRDAPLPPVSDPTSQAQVLGFLEATFDPSRTLLGRRQLFELLSDLVRAERDGITWKFVVVPEPIQNFGAVNAEDRFEGFAFERTLLLSFIDTVGIKNVVFLSADFHATLINNLAYQVPLPVGPGGATVPVSFPVAAFEIVHGPVAFFDGRFGPAVVNIAAAANLITPQELAFYNSLPVAVDGDSIPDDKDDFVKGLINGQLAPLQYDPIGLNDNLPAADGLIDATLLEGDYVAAHQFGWNEYHIDPVSQALTVTVWAIDAYSEAQQIANPAAVLDQTPRVVCKFRVEAQ